MFLSDLNNAEFSTIKDYIKNEFQNPQSSQMVSQPSFAPIATAKRKAGQFGTLAGIGTAKYVRDNKLNYRQKKQVKKWENLINPKPKKKFFFNPFSKRTQPTNSTIVN